MTVHGFWGLHVMPGKQYTQKVTLPFVITMASLADTITSNKRCSLLLNVDGVEFVLCSLIPNKVEQQVLSTTIMEGEEVTFSIKGDNGIHLTGNYVFDIIGNDNGTQWPEQILDQQNDASTSLNEKSMCHTTNNQQKRKRLPETNPQAAVKQHKGNDGLTSSYQHHHHESKCEMEQKKLQSYVDSLKGHVQKLEQQFSFITEGQQRHKCNLEVSASASTENSVIEQQNKGQGNQDQKNKKPDNDKKNRNDKNKKKLDGKKAVGMDTKIETTGTKKLQSTSASASTAHEESQLGKQSAKLKVVRLPNGMVVEDKKMGNGRLAGTGSKVGIQYIGKLLNGKKFDSTASGAPFRFTLGKGATIRGFDIGVAGMKVGSERKLVIPPSLAYGQRGMPPDIPPNSTLVFEVKLEELK